MHVIQYECMNYCMYVYAYMCVGTYMCWIVRVSVCVYVYACACHNACMIECLPVSTIVGIWVVGMGVYAPSGVPLHACLYGCTHVCGVCVWMYVCMH